MIITRWQASIIPTKEQIKEIFYDEGLDPLEEFIPKGKFISEFHSPFNEVRMVVEGELFMTISGNQLLLRAGDKIRIPSNTTQSKKTSEDKHCLCVYAFTAS